MTNSTITAFGDESIRLIANPAVYLLGATVIGSNSDLLSFRKLLPRNARKLHWREMTDKLRAQSVAALAKLDHISVIAVTCRIQPSG